MLHTSVVATNTAPRKTVFRRGGDARNLVVRNLSSLFLKFLEGRCSCSRCRQRIANLDTRVGDIVEPLARLSGQAPFHEPTQPGRHVQSTSPRSTAASVSETSSPANAFLLVSIS